jgi:hypothetical protein
MLVDICNKVKAAGKLREAPPSAEDNHHTKIKKTVRILTEYIDK